MIVHHPIACHRDGCGLWLPQKRTLCASDKDGKVVVVLVAAPCRDVQAWQLWSGAVPRLKHRYGLGLQHLIIKAARKLAFDLVSVRPGNKLKGMEVV